MNRKMKGFLAMAFLLIVSTLFLSACSGRMIPRFLPATPTLTPTPRALFLMPPERECPAELPSWQGVMPGQTTVTEAVAILGRPMGLGPEYRGTSTLLYLPVLTMPQTEGFDPTLISLREDGLVDWMELWVMDTDGMFHTVAEYVDIYGPTLDRVYRQEKNLHFGRAQIYVWAHCGIAVDAVLPESIKRTESEILSIAPKPPDVLTDNLMIKYPVPSNLSMTVVPDVEGLVVRIYLFEPTSYATFDEFYADFIPLYQDFRIYQQRFSHSTP